VLVPLSHGAQGSALEFVFSYYTFSWPISSPPRSLYWSPDQFIQQFIRHLHFDFPSIAQAQYYCPAPHSLLGYILPQCMTSPFTQMTKWKFYELSLNYSTLSFHRCN
jgi:hypothetical protein